MPTITRRNALGQAFAATGAMTLLPGAARAAPGAGAPFSFRLLQQRAAALARRPYKPPHTIDEAGKIDFDAIGSIRFRPEKTLAGGIRLFPLGNYARMPVTIHVVEGGRAQPVTFAPDFFESTGKVTPPPGFAGFRAMEPGRESDWLAFLGASYFRSAGSQDQYGLSARGLAINTGIDGREEFPNFIEFFIERGPGEGYTVHALLDGESVTGAYRFVCRHPGAVVQDVSAVLFLRRPVERLGIAPATSMFWYDHRAHPGAIDWRPEIHDSDGLALLSAGSERVFRPIRNPAHPVTDSFAANDVRAFGLLQRDRNFDHYQDDGAFYDRRPNLWIEPRGDWGEGRVMLFAFPTGGETTDNVNCFFVPSAKLRAGQRLQFDYRLTWTSDDPSVAAAAHAVDWWIGSAGRPGGPVTEGARKLVVDFVGGALAGLTRESGVSAEIGVGGGKLLTSAAYPVVGQKERWRVTADVAPEKGRSADVRLFLKRGDGALSETFLIPVDAT